MKPDQISRAHFLRMKNATLDMIDAGAAFGMTKEQVFKDWARFSKLTVHQVRLMAEGTYEEFMQSIRTDETVKAEEPDHAPSAEDLPTRRQLDHMVSWGGEHGEP